MNFAHENRAKFTNILQSDSSAAFICERVNLQYMLVVNRFAQRNVKPVISAYSARIRYITY